MKKGTGTARRCLGQGLRSSTPGCQANIQRRVHGIMQAMINKVRELNNQLQGNRSNPKEAGAGGAAAKSAMKSRNLNLFVLAYSHTLCLPDRPRWR